jgi:ABC-type dipeptide/oligopeptide/nickel transport system permease component
MSSYIARRLLLMIPTLLGVLLMTFVVIQFVPGGPVEQMVSQLQGRDSGGEGAAVAGAGYRGRQGVDAARIEEIRQQYARTNHNHLFDDRRTGNVEWIHARRTNDCYLYRRLEQQHCLRDVHDQPFVDRYRRWIYCGYGGHI